MNQTSSLVSIKKNAQGYVSGSVSGPVEYASIAKDCLNASLKIVQVTFDRGTFTSLMHERQVPVPTIQKFLESVCIMDETYLIEEDYK